jgi:hypothetical protein
VKKGLMKDYKIVSDITAWIIVTFIV